MPSMARTTPPAKKTQHMKHITRHSPFKSLHLIIVSILAMVAFASVPVGAQTNSPAPQNFFQTAENYFTSANTNYTWAGNTLEIPAGADYMSSVNWANYLDAQYDFSSSSSLANHFAIEAKMRNAGIAGTVDSVQVGIQYTLVSFYSVKLEAGLDGGYDLDRNSALIEPKFTLRDKLTPNTFAGIVLSLPIWTGGHPVNNVPDIGLEAGFTY